ncbi:hypothetical protein ANN_01764 [Periplaneta americana]|uniref:Uncharacterized protein n=1 Tax=Periplaneta americana TaxID=6978 RepID=A0ABQ8TUH4_PERAM|nr:hypothetical protein ANN_01764 [Periplaneta americana]
MSPGSSTESYLAFARIGLRKNPGKNLNQVTCPDRDSNPGHLVSRPDALTATPQLWLAFVMCSVYMEVEICGNSTHPYLYSPQRANLPVPSAPWGGVTSHSSTTSKLNFGPAFIDIYDVVQRAASRGNPRVAA